MKFLICISILMASLFSFSEETSIDLSQMLKDAKMVPHMKDGKMVGLKIVELKEGSSWQKMGLKVGDVINAVNGKKIESPEESMEIYSELKDDSDI